MLMNDKMNKPEFERIPIREMPIDLDRSSFMLNLVAGISGSLEEVVGLEEAAGFISIVGANMGHKIGESYYSAMGKEKLDQKQVAEVLLDLKRRIGGEFRLAEQTYDKLVFVNTRCPFGDDVIGHKSLCMMTSNVFGKIAADNLGYACVELDKTIAAGDGSCRVIVHTDVIENLDNMEFREYFAIEDN
tara:strand:- start:170 stop:733 length:564 start_codon:yes stop_codon:yes gene_type:complete